MSDNRTLLKYAKDLPGVLEHLYRTPTDVSQWRDFLAKLTDATNSRSARLLVMDKEAKRVHYSDKINCLIPHVQQVLHLNRAMTLRDRVLVLKCRRSQMHFQRAVRASSMGTVGTLEPILVHGQERRAPLRLMVEPIGIPGVAPVFWAGEATVAVYIQDPEQHLDVDEELLARLFGLTPAEGRVGAGLALGKDIASLSEEAGTTVNTVRTQLKSVMAKTATRRQAELVRLVLQSAAVRSVNQGQAPIQSF